MADGFLTCKDHASNVFCYGRLLHDVQVYKIFDNPRVFLELWARRSPNVIVSRYKALRPKIKLSESSGREALEKFVENNFVNKSCHERTVPSDWTAAPRLLKQIRHGSTRQRFLSLNRKFEETYKLTSEAAESFEHHSTLQVMHPFHGSSYVLDYRESWWIYQALMRLGMNTSAKQLIENLAGLVHKCGYVPAENRVYFLGRGAPPFLAIILEDYYNKTDDKELSERILPLAELDFHYWVNSTVNQALSAFDVFLFSRERQPLNPRPERYLQDWMRVPVRENGSVFKSGLTVKSVLWETGEPKGTVKVKTIAITEWAARSLRRLCQIFKPDQNDDIYRLLSSELLHTIDALMYSSYSDQWMDYSPHDGHKERSLWPVYTGARGWMDHYQINNGSDLEETFVAVDCLLKAGKIELAKRLVVEAFNSADRESQLSLKNASILVILISKISDLELPQIRMDSDGSAENSRTLLVLCSLTVTAITSIVIVQKIKFY
ncbi:alpha,alpha-trehalase [Nesidiocoris tenuis]|uniref:Trehalase n=1 Tax=Nesidiocoris tenuis TaxID=355587 RepID=A0ABN7AZI2_9HEMI|nr:alpha,alpha-trehalase [Nesidiocoris tenuis]